MSRRPALFASALGLTCVLASLNSLPAAAQQYTGTFTVPNQSGGVMTVSLQETGGGVVAGRLSSNGVEYAMEGRIEEGTLAGLMQGVEGVLYFAAERWEDELWLELYGVDGNGQPNYEDYTEIDLTIASTTAQGGGSSPSVAAQGQRSEGGLPASTGAATASERVDAQQSNTGRPLAPGFTEDHPQVREWVTFLAGKKLTRMSSYSSGTAGGYNARTDVYLCSDRSYALRDESSVSVDVGGAFGNNGGVAGEQGRWYVITNGQVIGLILESATGEVSEFRMDYQNQETYANGERVYVTPAEVCR